MAQAPLTPLFVDPVFSIVQRFSFLGQKCQTSFYYRRPAGGAVAMGTILQELADLWRTNALPAIQNLQSTNTVNFENRIYCMTQPQYATLITATPTLQGLRPGEPMPPQIALVLSKRTAFRGRHAQGRMYIAGVSETDNVNGVPSDPLKVVAAASITTLLSTLGPGAAGGTYTPVVASLTTLKNIGTPEAPVWQLRGADCLTMSCDDIWYTQRRRTIGVGQ